MYNEIKNEHRSNVINHVLCVTNRKLCEEDFLTRAERIAKAHPAGIILREKDLSQADYKKLAREVISICEKYNVPCILHSFVEVAMALQVQEIHLPLDRLMQLREEEKAQFTVIGVSCHSIEDAMRAKEAGCTYIVAGHIFATDCKKGLPGRGLGFLQDVCKSVDIPVYAIGGITSEKIGSVRETGAVGVCVMSGLMKCEAPEKYLADMKEKG